MQNAGLNEAQAGIKVARRNISNLRYVGDTTLMAESEELKSLLMKVKEQSEKAGLKLNIQKMKIMASSPITSWHVDGETMETVIDFIFLGSKITADGDAAMKLKDACSLEGRKEVLVAQLCPTLCDHMDCSPPGSFVHEIFQARILEWVAISFSKGSSQPRDWT